MAPPADSRAQAPETPPESNRGPATLGAADLAVLRMDQDGRHPVPKVRPQIPGYDIIGTIGKGVKHGRNMLGRVQQNLDRLVALKVIRPELLDDPAIVQRFQREARAAARLAHPNIVTIFDAAEANGVHFLVMEFIEGDNLGSLIRQQKPLPAGQVCEWMRWAALGLAHLHERGLVHRDIKPHNLFLKRGPGAWSRSSNLGLGDAVGQRSTPRDEVDAVRHDPGDAGLFVPGAGDERRHRRWALGHL